MKKILLFFIISIPYAMEAANHKYKSIKKIYECLKNYAEDSLFQKYKKFEFRVIVNSEKGSRFFEVDEELMELIVDLENQIKYPINAELMGVKPGEKNFLNFKMLISLLNESIQKNIKKTRSVFILNISVDRSSTESSSEESSSDDSSDDGYSSSSTSSFDSTEYYPDFKKFNQYVEEKNLLLDKNFVSLFFQELTQYDNEERNLYEAKKNRKKNRVLIPIVNRL